MHRRQGFQTPLSFSVSWFASLQVSAYAEPRFPNGPALICVCVHPSTQITRNSPNHSTLHATLLGNLSTSGRAWFFVQLLTGTITAFEKDTPPFLSGLARYHNSTTSIPMVQHSHRHGSPKCCMAITRLRTNVPRGPSWGTMAISMADLSRPVAIPWGFTMATWMVMSMMISGSPQRLTMGESPRTERGRSSR